MISPSKMDFHHIIVFTLFLVLCKESFCQPVEKAQTKTVRFRALIPAMKFSREKRAEGDQQSGGVGEVLTTAIKDGIAASSVVDSPTMMVGGFSIMMQPMPKGSEFADQLMQMAPHYLSLLPGAGRK